MMTTTIKQWGNSRAIRLPKELLNLVSLSTDDIVEVNIEDNKIVIQKSKVERPTIKQLFDSYTGDYKTEELDWGAEQGKEVW